MTKRVLAGTLWFFATWYAWNIFASFAGLSEIAGPILGLATGLLLAVDPLERIWTPKAAAATQADVSPIAEPA